MPARYRIAYLAHSLQSDWNNGNAHFLRGLLRALTAMGNDVVVFEPADAWSMVNLRLEQGDDALATLKTTYPDLKIQTYTGTSTGDPEEAASCWSERLQGFDVVVLHEWNPPELAGTLIAVRSRLGFSLLFHDTHHRASSSPQQIERFGLARFDAILAFGVALKQIYEQQYGLARVWVLHEAADTTVFKPLPDIEKTLDVVWVGNWGEGERTWEINEFLLRPIGLLQPRVNCRIYGVRYPREGLEALQRAGVEYGGYLPNLFAPDVYSAAKMTVHVPRQQYSGAMQGIPTIRVFEALACGIPLASAPWMDCEGLFREGDFWMVRNGAEMQAAMRTLLVDRTRAQEQAASGLETVLLRHTCVHRAHELTAILDEVRA